MNVDYTAVFWANGASVGRAPFPTAPPPPADAGGAAVRVVASGPGVAAPFGTVLTLAFGARHRLWMVRPCYVFGNALAPPGVA